MNIFYYRKITIEKVQRKIVLSHPIFLQYFNYFSLCLHICSFFYECIYTAIIPTYISVFSYKTIYIPDEK